MFFSRIRRQIRKRFSARTPKKTNDSTQGMDVDSNKNPSQSNQQSLDEGRDGHDSTWSKATQFRSDTTLNGSSIVKINQCANTFVASLINPI